jgi:hypothetical protein
MIRSGSSNPPPGWSWPNTNSPPRAVPQSSTGTTTDPGRRRAGDRVRGRRSSTSLRARRGRPSVPLRGRRDQQHPTGIGVGDRARPRAADGDQALAAALHRAVAHSGGSAPPTCVPSSPRVRGHRSPARPVMPSSWICRFAPTRSLMAYTVTPAVDGGVTS